MAPYSEFAHDRYIEYFLLRNVTAKGPVVGHYEGQDVRQSIVDEWGRRYSFVGIAAFKWNGEYDCDALKAGEFILPPGLVYRLDLMPPTWRKFFFGKH